MNSDENGFLKEIAQHPNDDALRMIFADWLDERGDPRGEFIRAQCELANGCWGMRRTLLQSKSKILLKKHGAAWREPFKKWGNVAFDKGLPERISVTATSFLKHGSKIVDDPRICQVRLIDDLKPFIDRLAKSKPLRRVTSLALNNNGMPPAQFANLFKACLSFPQLRRLDLSQNRLDVHAMKALAKTDMPKLEHLDLASNMLEQPGLEALVDWEPFRQLESFNISSNMLTAQGTLLLLKLECFQREMELNFANSNTGMFGENKVDDLCLAAWAKSPSLSRCRRIRLDCEAITKDGWTSLSEAADRSNVREMVFTFGESDAANELGNGIESGTAFFLNTPFVQPCRSLSFPTYINDEILTAIANSPMLGNLEHLSLSAKLSAGRRRRVEQTKRFENVSITYE